MVNNSNYSIKQRTIIARKKHDLTISTTNWTDDQTILITLVTSQNQSPLAPPLLCPNPDPKPEPFFLHRFTTPVTCKTRQEADAAAALASTHYSSCFGKPLKQSSNGALVHYLHHLLDPADVPPIDKQPRRNQVIAAFPLHKLSQLIPIPSVHRNVPLARRDPQSSNRRSHSLAILECLPHSPQAGNVQHHSLLPLGRADLLQLVEKRGRFSEIWVYVFVVWYR